MTLILALSILAQDAPTQIHLSYGSDPSTQMIVMWRTASSTSTHQVKFGTTISLGATASGTAVGTLHTVSLDGLQPSTLYYYSCGSAAGWSAAKTFRTAPASPQKFVIAAYGDAGITSNSKAVVAAVNGAKPDLVVLLGDLSYANGGSQKIWDTWFQNLQLAADHVPHMPSLGNHETYGNDLNTYLARFTLPNNERWYSYNAGDLHLIALDSMSPLTPGSPQYEWLAADLAQAVQNPQIRWKIAYLHYPPFTSGMAHPNDGAAIRTHGVPLFDAYHVDLVLAGHEHNYERSFPLNEGGVKSSSSLTNYPDPTGTIYVVSGTGGQSLYNQFASPKPDWSVYRSAWHGFTKITVDTNHTMAVQGLRTSGTTADGFTVSKSPADTMAPKIAIVSPKNGTFVSEGSLTVKTKAMDNAGVTKVEFLVDGVLLSTDTLAPFQATWDAGAAPLGTHTVLARAYDLAGNVGTSTLSVARSKPVTYVAPKSAWKYHDLGQDLGAGWRDAAYDDSAWKSGPGILGYGENYVATTISYGPNSSDKRRTAYFRAKFDVTDPAQSAGLTLKIMIDDGFVAHLNGVEIARGNLPSGAVLYSTLASQTIEANNAYVSVDVSAFKSKLVPGSNLLAVEVHQSSKSSSDLVFDASLVGQIVPAASAVASAIETQDATAPGGAGGCGMVGLEVLLWLGMVSVLRYCPTRHLFA